MTWLQYAALTWKPAFSIGGVDHLEDQESASESLNVYPEACASAMLETARLSVSLEGDENFRGANGILSNMGCPESPTNSSISSCSSDSISRSSSNSQCRQVARSKPLEERRSSNLANEATKSLTLLPQVHERQTARMRTRSEWFLSPHYPQMECQCECECAEDNCE